MNQLELRDIHLPDAVLWWPPAWGWWILLLVIVVMVLMAPKLYRWFRHKTLKKRSINSFDRIQLNYYEHADQRRLVADISTLLRRVMIAYRGRERTAGLAGEKWVAQLTELVDTPCFDDEQLQLLSRGQYARDLSVDEQALLNSCRNWINALPRSRSDVSI